MDSLEEIDTKNLPRHIAIIMDGNRRWAYKNALPSVAGHWEGVNALMDTVEAAEFLIERLRFTKTNDEFFDSMKQKK